MSLAGAIGPVELRPAKSWDPRSGWSIVRRWRGEESVIAILADQYRAAGYRVEVDPSDDGSYDILRVQLGAEETQPPDQPLADQWTLAGNDLEKSLWSLPVIRTEMDACENTMALAMLRADIEAMVRGETAVPDPQTPSTTIDLTLDGLKSVVEELGMNWAPWLALITSLARGEESYSVSQYVLRHVLTIGSNSTIKPSYDNVGRMYSTASLEAAEQIPSTLKFVLPAGFWLKRTPTVDQTAADKYQITQEWWHAEQYDPFIYGEPV